MPEPMKDVAAKRLASLDALRAVAILLVLAAHGRVAPEEQEVLYAVTRYCRRGGGVGVDLFFVLSGFLIGGLLFREYRQYGAISFGRFFVRRGLKIYPAFYVFLAVAIVGRICKSLPITWRDTLGEVLFLQNYLGNFWGHEWSLAVEEHFYLLLPAVLFALIRQNPPFSPGNRTGRDPFEKIPRLFLALACGELCLRVLNACYWDHYTNNRCAYPTHLRIDSLMFGVLCAYYFYFRHDAFIRFVLPRRGLIAALGTGLLLTAFCAQGGTIPFMYTAGFTIFYLGGGLLLSAMIVREDRPGPVLASLARLGAYSYSIYLWHMPFRDWICPFLAEWFAGSWSKESWQSYAAWEGVYLAGSIVFGIVMSKAIEYPVLHFRDRLFPSRSGALLQETARPSFCAAATPA